MNIGKSIKIALINNNMKSKDLAAKLGVLPPKVSILCGKTTCSGKMLDSLCAAFEMKASDFVALGE